jgi:hypothetical protein
MNWVFKSQKTAFFTVIAVKTSNLTRASLRSYIRKAVDVLTYSGHNLWFKLGHDFPPPPPFHFTIYVSLYHSSVLYSDSDDKLDTINKLSFSRAGADKKNG